MSACESGSKSDDSENFPESGIRSLARSLVGEIDQLARKISLLNWNDIINVTTTIASLLKDTGHLLDQFRQMKLAYPTHFTGGMAY
jgi:hypothetical protein